MGSRAAKAWADSDGGKVEIPPIRDQPNFDKALKPVESAATAAKISELLSGEEGKGNSASLDSYMQSQLNPLASDIIKLCLPHGLQVPFPTNVSYLNFNIQLCNRGCLASNIHNSFHQDLCTDGDNWSERINSKSISSLLCAWAAGIGRKACTKDE